MRALLGAAGAAAVVLATAACGGPPSSAAARGREPAAAAAGGTGRTLTVFAAASLQQTFTRIGTQFEHAHPGVRVVFSFAGSSDLAAQLVQGAPADVYASADTRTMDTAVSGGAVEGAPVVFATNALEIAVPPGNPAGVRSFADLARPGLKVVVCAPQVPCGSATDRVERASGVALRPVSEEQSVTDVLGKVMTGEADAGLVYVTDVRRAGSRVDGVPFAQSRVAVNMYPIAVVKGSRNPALARQLVTAVTGTPGQDVLRAAGFGAP